MTRKGARAFPYLMIAVKPILLGCAGLGVTDEERDFFAQTNPLGFILFARNIENPDQVRALTAALREAVGRTDAPIFIDQEGGRVARLRPPHWPALPAMAEIGALYKKDAAKGLAAMRLHSTITAAFLRDIGIDGNCAPVLDLSVPDTSSVMGDRTFADDASAIEALGRVAVQSYLAHGVLPVIKHIPGHGRVKVDPHEVLPFVDTDEATLEAQDFVPFKALAAEAPIAMNCHVLFRALDPDYPVSLSRKVHAEILRGKIGFEGLIFSDDLAMKALNLPLRELGVKALAAGADVILYCPGVLADSREVCADLPPMTQAATDRLARARALCGRVLPDRGPETALLAEMNALLCG